MAARSNSEKVTIKAATARDFAALLELIRDYYRFDRIPFNPRAIRAGLRLLLRDEIFGRAWLILNRIQPVGYIILTFGFDLEFGGRQATVTDLYIKRAQRGKGLGPKLLLRVEDFCRESGVQALELQVTRRNIRAVAFYERFGFQAHDRIPMSKRIAPAT